MRKIADFINFKYDTPMTEGSVGFALFGGGKRYVAVFSQPDWDYYGVSVTNGIEYAIKAAKKVFPEINSENTIFVEHYPASTRGSDGESFDIVTHDTSGINWFFSTRAKIEKIIGRSF